MSRTLVVSDTSPLNYLILIKEIELLTKFAPEVLIPPAVAAELRNSRAPLEVVRWISSPPPWLKIIAPENVDLSLELDRGEAEAISLAVEQGIRAILIDERKGFRVAKSLGLEPFGILAVLEASASRGYVNFDEAVERLRRTNFHFSESLIVEAKRRLGA